MCISYKSLLFAWNLRESWSLSVIYASLLAVSVTAAAAYKREWYQALARLAFESLEGILEFGSGVGNLFKSGGSKGHEPFERRVWYGIV